MVSLYDSFSMFPAAHHPHHPAAHAAAAAAAAGGSSPHPHHLLGRHQPGVVSSVGPGVGHHHQGVVPHHHHHHGQHHQMAAANQAAYFASYSHPHHWGGGGGGGGGNPVGGIQQNPAAAAAVAAAGLQSYNEHGQQFGGLMTAADGGNAWHSSPAAVAYSAATGISSLSPARTPVTSVGYEEWASSPGGNNNPNNQSQGVSSPDGSPAFHQHGQQQVGPGSPGGLEQHHPAYGKIFVGGAEFIPPYHLAGHVGQQHGQDLQQHRNSNGPSSTTGIVGLPSGVTGHHSPDSGLAGSDGLSSAGSPAQQQQSMLGSSAGLMVQQGVQSAGGSMQGQQSNGMGGQNGGNGVSRPQPSRSPFEWMKKPSYHTNNANPAGKTRTKDKYRVVYTDHQRLELEKEFHYSRYITIRRKSELASVLGLSERQVKIWFQNRRAKERKQVKKREEMLHKEKDVPVVVQQQQQVVQQQQHHHQQVVQQHNMHGQQHVVHPAQISSFGGMDTKPVMGMD